MLGVSHDPAHCLPPGLLTRVGLTLTLAPPDAALLRQVAAEVTGHSAPAPVPEGLPGRVTPEMLQLACQPGQSATG